MCFETFFYEAPGICLGGKSDEGNVADFDVWVFCVCYKGAFIGAEE